MQRYNREINAKVRTVKRAKASFRFKEYECPLKTLRTLKTKTLLNLRTKLYKRASRILGREACALLFNGSDIQTLQTFINEYERGNGKQWGIVERVKSYTPVA